jgi:hypothetical protein
MGKGEEKGTLGAGEHQERERAIYTFRKNSRESVCASLSRFRGRDYVDLRVFVESTSGDLVPTGKGLTLPREQVAELAAAVAALRSACKG